MENEPFPVLYILMRNDLDSMNPGKAVAQGAHAANQFGSAMEDLKDRPEIGDALTMGEEDLLDRYNAWRNQTSQGFGTTITLGVDEWMLHLVVEAAKDAGYAADVTHDPEYPLVDGRVVHKIPLDTCGYVFGYKDKLKILLGQFDLLP